MKRSCLRTILPVVLWTIFCCAACITIDEKADVEQGNSPPANRTLRRAKLHPATINVAAVCVGVAVDMGVIALTKSPIVAKIASGVAAGAVRQFEDVEVYFSINGATKKITFPQITENTPALIEVDNTKAYLILSGSGTLSEDVLQRVPPTCLLSYSPDGLRLVWHSHNAEFAKLNGMNVPPKGSMAVEEITPFIEPATAKKFFVLEVGGSSIAKDTLDDNHIVKAESAPTQTLENDTTPRASSYVVANANLILEQVAVHALEQENCEEWNFDIQVGLETFPLKTGNYFCTGKVLEVNQTNNLFSEAEKIEVVVTGRRNNKILQGKTHLIGAGRSPSSFKVDVNTLMKQKNEASKTIRTKSYFTFYFKCAPQAAP